MADGIRVLGGDELEDAAGTPGIRRRVAFESDAFWFGHAETEPQTMSGWHHHGENVTVGYVLRGEARLEYGPGGQRSVDVMAGDYFMVPAGLVHREGNATDQPGEVLIARIGKGPPVFPVDGPEPG